MNTKELIQKIKNRKPTTGQKKTNPQYFIGYEKALEDIISLVGKSDLKQEASKEKDHNNLITKCSLVSLRIIKLENELNSLKNDWIESIK